MKHGWLWAGLKAHKALGPTWLGENKFFFLFFKPFPNSKPN
jgi:hypothetical protein